MLKTKEKRKEDVEYSDKYPLLLDFLFSPYYTNIFPVSVYSCSPSFEVIDNLQLQTEKKQLTVSRILSDAMKRIQQTNSQHSVKIE